MLKFICDDDVIVFINIDFFKEQKSILEAKNLENKKEAEVVKAKIDGKSFILIRSASDTGALYGSVSSKDINEIVSADGIEISKNQIKLEKPIKELGVYKIIVSLHSDISAEIFINVARSIEPKIAFELSFNINANGTNE